jgi:hypothetical protein
LTVTTFAGLVRDGYVSVSIAAASVDISAKNTSLLTSMNFLTMVSDEAFVAIAFYHVNETGIFITCIQSVADEIDENPVIDESVAFPQNIWQIAAQPRRVINEDAVEGLRALHGKPD